jgi:hypothetical protein
MLEIQKQETRVAGNGAPYDLEERTYGFARDVRVLVKRLPRTLTNISNFEFVSDFGFRISDFFPGTTP